MSSSPYPPPKRGHFSSEEIADLRLREELDARTAKRLVNHLSTLCPTCWQNVNATDYYDLTGPRTFDPVIAALRRVRTRDTEWRSLAGNHMEVLGQVRETLFGFSFLAIEEATAMVEDRRFELDRLTRALGFERANFKRLFTAAPPKADVAAQYMATAFRTSLVRGKVERVIDRLGGLSEDSRLESEESFLKILEVTAMSACEVGKPEEARKDLWQAYHLTREKRPFRNLELGQQLAGVLIGMYPKHKKELLDLIDDVIEVHRILLDGAKPEMKFFAVLLLARFLDSIDSELRQHPRGDEPLPKGAPAGTTLCITDLVPLNLVKQTYRLLKRSGEFFEHYTNLKLQAERYRYLLNFSFFVDKQKSLMIARKLHETCEKLGPDHWHEALAIRGVIVALEWRRYPKGAEKLTREFFEELSAWLPPEEIEELFNEISAMFPSADLRGLVRDDLSASN